MAFGYGKPLSKATRWRIALTQPAKEKARRWPGFY